MEKINVSTESEMRRPPAAAYNEHAAADGDTDTLSELSENELLFGFLNPNPLLNTSSLTAGGQGQVTNAFSVGD